MLREGRRGNDNPFVSPERSYRGSRNRLRQFVFFALDSRLKRAGMTNHYPRHARLYVAGIQELAEYIL